MDRFRLEKQNEYPVEINNIARIKNDFFMI